MREVIAPSYNFKILNLIISTLKINNFISFCPFQSYQYSKIPSSRNWSSFQSFNDGSTGCPIWNITTTTNASWTFTHSSLSFTIYFFNVRIIKSFVFCSIKAYQNSITCDHESIINSQITSGIILFTGCSIAGLLLIAVTVKYWGKTAISG